MDKNRYYFYIGGFVSISLTLFFLIIAIFLVSNPIKKESYGLKKDNYISISFEIFTPKKNPSLMPEEKFDEKKIEKIIEKIEPRADSQVEPQKHQAINKNENIKKTEKIQNIQIDSLFGAVEDKNIKPSQQAIKQKDEIVDKRLLDELEKKISKVTENRVDLISKKIEMIQNSKASNPSSKSSTAKEIDEYVTKVQMLVYENFKPPKNSANSYAKAVIELDSMGRLVGFKIVNYSNNDALNLEVDKIKNRLANVVFPKNPDRISAKFMINLIPKE